MNRGNAWAGLLLAAAVLPGCIGLVVGTAVDDLCNALAYPVNEYLFLGAWKYDNDPDAPWRDLEDDRGRDFGGELVGLAVSGGGSRSACFVASALDEMRVVPAGGAPGRSLLDEVDFISSVSGGSLSSAYYVLHRPRGPDKAALDGFFARYRTEMRRNFERRSLGRMFLLFRWVPMLLTYYDRARLMAETWDANLFHGAVFADLPEPGDGIPSLIVNATSYSNGNAFVISRIPSRRFRQSTVFRDLPGLLLHSGGAAPEHKPFFTAGFDTLDSDVGSYPISMGVVASASVPGLLGPVILKDRSQVGRLESLGDGGGYDNYGLETLVTLFATILEERPGLKARIIIVDGSGYFPSYRDFQNPSLGDYVDRTTSISWNRASGYSSLLFQLLRRTCIDVEDDGHGGKRTRARIGDQEDSPYRNLSFEVLSLYHRRTAEDLKAEAKKVTTLETIFTARPITEAMADFNARVRGIGTRLRISDEDADIVDTQARAAVRDVLGGGKEAPP